MGATFQTLITLAGIAALVALSVGATFVVGWLVGLGFRYAPLVGRRHRSEPLVGREPVETESGKHWTQRQSGKRR